jgi:hypothetical protein
MVQNLRGTYRDQIHAGRRPRGWSSVTVEGRDSRQSSVEGQRSRESIREVLPQMFRVVHAARKHRSDEEAWPQGLGVGAGSRQGTWPDLAPAATRRRPQRLGRDKGMRVRHTSAPCPAAEQALAAQPSTGWSMRGLVPLDRAAASPEFLAPCPRSSLASSAAIKTCVSDGEDAAAPRPGTSNVEPAGASGRNEDAVAGEDRPSPPSPGDRANPSRSFDRYRAGSSYLPARSSRAMVLWRCLGRTLVPRPQWPRQR